MTLSRRSLVWTAFLIVAAGVEALAQTTPVNSCMEQLFHGHEKRPEGKWFFSKPDAVGMESAPEFQQVELDLSLPKAQLVITINLGTPRLNGATTERSRGTQTAKYTLTLQAAKEQKKNNTTYYYYAYRTESRPTGAADDKNIAVEGVVEFHFDKEGGARLVISPKKSLMRKVGEAMGSGTDEPRLRSGNGAPGTVPIQARDCPPVPPNPTLDAQSKTPAPDKAQPSPQQQSAQVNPQGSPQSPGRTEVPRLQLSVSLPNGRRFAQIKELRVTPVYSNGRELRDGAPFVVAESPFTGPEGPLPSAIKVTNDPDFESDSPQTVPADGRVTLSLRVKSRVVEMLLVDADEPARTIWPGEVTISIAGLRRTLNRDDRRHLFYASCAWIRGDLISVSATASGYEPMLRPYEPTAEGLAADVAANKPIRISLRSLTHTVTVKPFVRAREPNHPVNVNVTFQYAEGGRQKSLPANGTAAAYPAKLPRSLMDTITLNVMDGGSEHFKNDTRFYSPPVTSIPKDILVEMQFAKPALGVVYNPTEQLRLIKSTDSVEDDLRIKVWQFFQLLCTNREWTGRFAYSYLMKGYSGSGIEPVFWQEDTTRDFSRQEREKALDDFALQGPPLSVDQAIERFAEYLRGFSYPPRGRRGVLVYVTGAPYSVIVKDDQRFDELEQKLRKENLLAVVVSILPGDPPRPSGPAGASDPLLTSGKFRNLRYLQFGGPEQAGLYFNRTFDPVRDALRNLIDTASAPVLKLTVNQTRPFIQGQRDAEYTLTVSNEAEAGDSTGQVTVEERLPMGMELTYLNGEGWSCDKAARQCRRQDPLQAGETYKPITVRLNVADNEGPKLYRSGFATHGRTRADSMEALEVRERPKETIPADPVVERQPAGAPPQPPPAAASTSAQLDSRTSGGNPAPTPPATPKFTPPVAGTTPERPANLPVFAGPDAPAAQLYPSGSAGSGGNAAARPGNDGAETRQPPVEPGGAGRNKRSSEPSGGSAGTTGGRAVNNPDRAAGTFVFLGSGPKKPERVELIITRTSPVLEGTLDLKGVPDNKHKFPKSRQLAVRTQNFKEKIADGKAGLEFDVRVIHQDKGDSYRIIVTAQQTASDKEPIVDVLVRREKR